jgi:predicted DNA-binding transcriptional regulator AlpA
MWEKIGLAPSRIWRLSQQDQSPEPIKLSSGCTAWFENEINESRIVKAKDRETAVERTLERVPRYV